MILPVRLPGQTRGEANSNPGNIDRTQPRTPWQGRVPDAELTDPRFEQFVHPKWGLRAIAGTLIAYRDKHGLDTVRGLINRWAPPVENQTDAYVFEVCTRASCGPDDKLDLEHYATMRGLVVGIVIQENGRQPYPEALLAEGMKLAGVVGPAPALAATNTGRAALSVGSAGVLSIGVQHLATALPAGHVATAVHAAAPVLGLGIVWAALAGVLAARASHRQVTGA